MAYIYSRVVPKSAPLLIYFMIELLAHNYSKLNAFILMHCGLYINYITICLHLKIIFHTFHIL